MRIKLDDNIAHSMRDNEGIIVCDNGYVYGDTLPEKFYKGKSCRFQLDPTDHLTSSTNASFVYYIMHPLPSVIKYGLELPL